MAETSLSALAQNLEAGEWPIEGSDETPSKYIVYTWDEVQTLPAFIAQPALLDLLLRILNDTLAFDEPFQEMVDASQKSIVNEFSAIKALGKLQIPEDFPIALSSLSNEAKELCKSQGFRTLGEYVRLSQKISQLIIMEGDFRAFLNALSHVDETTIARFLPFRPGHKGLHLAEAIGAVIRSIPDAELYALARATGYKYLTPEQTAMADAVTKQRLADTQASFRTAFLDQLGWFKTEAADWRNNQTGNQSLSYRLRVLDDPLREAVAYGLIHNQFAGTPQPMSASTLPSSATQAPFMRPPPAEVSGEKPGFFQRLLGLFGRK